MCGISGFVNLARTSAAADLEAMVERMSATLSHRGPDDRGTWWDADAGVALGHRRLSIIDLSVEGRQPMTSESGRYVIVYNGEVYNFRELRTELEPLGHRFRGHSDTEAMLAAIEQWGIEGAVRRFHGMFAFAVWDRHERVLTLVRDRLGIKPLYYAVHGRLLVFGSELRSLVAHPSFVEEIDRDALALYLRHAHVPAPYSIYRGAWKLAPGTILEARAGEGGIATSQATYWSAIDAARRGFDDPFRGSESDALEELDRRLREAVRTHMVADVPYGAFLSGGIDSSTIVALMQGQCSRPVRTFTIGFESAEFDESADARAVAEHLGTEHHELRVEPRDALELVPRLAEIFDEPFADPSQIPTCLVARLTRPHVTVALSGDGGDELFAGYDRYRWADRLWRGAGWLPVGVRGRFASFLEFVPADVLDAAAAWLPSRSRVPRLGEKVHRAAALIRSMDADSMQRAGRTVWHDAEAIVLGARRIHEPADDLTVIPDSVSRMQLLDMLTYLPDGVLTKVDRASMSHGLEARVPMLDHRVVELAWRIPPVQKTRDGISKWILRRVARRYLPCDQVRRPKRGFGVPIDRWLRSDLRDWGEELLEVRSLRHDDLLDTRAVRALWKQHLSGRARNHDRLWAVLMFLAWKARRRI